MAKTTSIKTALATGIFDARPGPTNVCLHPATIQIALNNRHPLYRPVTARFRSFDTTKLHWSVGTLDFSAAKAVVRNYANKRIKAAFIGELSKLGRDRDGRLIDKSNGQTSQDGSRRFQSPLRGALVILVREAAVTAPFTQIEETCRELLNQVVEWQGMTSTGSQRRGNAVGRHAHDRKVRRA